MKTATMDEVLRQEHDERMHPPKTAGVRSAYIHSLRSTSTGALSSLRTARRSSADLPTIPLLMSNSTSIRFTASSASGETGGGSLPRRFLAAMSASSKKLRRECAQHAASMTGPGDLPAA